MHKEFKRKPHRKSIIRTDMSRHGHEDEALSRERHSSQIKRTLEQQRDKATHHGRVVATAGNLWYVCEDENMDGVVGEYTNVVETQIGGLAITNNDDDTLVCVGDYVRFAEATEKSGRAIIIEIEQRKSRLLRKTAGERTLMQSLASNIDHCVIVNSAAEPFYNRRLIDRYLIAIEQGGMKPIIVINKIELMPEDVLREDLECYTRLGIDVFFCSCVTGKGIQELATQFTGRTSVLAGPSGVGKSSLINACFHLELQKVREISTKYDKGKHTTTGARMFGLPGGGCIVDTPGIREFAITDVHIDDLSYYFHDFDGIYQDCKYLPCTHTHEPECAVKRAVEENRIDAGRYDSYLRIRESMEAGS